jgi:hypothetical protein
MYLQRQGGDFVKMKEKHLNMNQGVPVSDNHNSLNNTHLQRLH